MGKFFAVIALWVLSGCAALPQKPVRQDVSKGTLSRWELDQAFLSAQLYIFAGNNKRAASVLNEAVLRAPAEKSLDFQMMLARVEEDLGKFESSHKRYQKLLLQNPHREEVLKEAARFYYGIKLKEEAYNLYSKLVEINPAYSNYWIYRGLLALELVNAKEAWESFDYLIRNSKDAKHLGHLYMGKLMQMTSFEKKAEFEFRKCLRVKSESKECTLELARLKRTQNDLVGSRNILRDFLKKHSFRENGVIAEELITWSVQEGKLSLAVQTLKRLERSRPADINIKRKLATLMAKNKNFDEALSRMDLVLKNNEVTEGDHLNYVNILRLSKNDEKAYKFINSKKSMSKAKEKTFFVKYEMDILKFGDKTAEKKLTTLCLRAENKKDCLYVHAYIMWKAGKYKRAQASLRSAIRKKGGDLKKYNYFLSQMYYEDNQKKKAMGLIDKLIEKNKNYSPALNFKAYHLAELGEDLIKAEELVVRAVTVEPRNGHYLDTYGYVLLQSGRAGEALAILKEAFRLMPNEPELVEHLADAYKQTKNIKMAIRFYTLASSLYKGENRKRVGGKIAQIKTQRSISSVSNDTDAK